MKTDGYTLVDYLKFRGDISFEERSLNDLDNLILCQISYLTFDDVVPFMKRYTGLTLHDCYLTDQITAKQEGEDYQARRMENFELAAKSKRFGGLEIGEYVDILSNDISMQFAAMTFHINDHLSFVAFRGTGDTIVGWKEDFMISFTKIEAQKAAVEYLNHVISLDDDRKYIVAGHSKGANLAIFASASLSKEKQDKIISIYNNDGPGICSDVMDPSIIDPIRDRVIRIEPGYCVIGKLFEEKFNNTTIVKSYESGLQQHDLATWMCDGPQLYKIYEHEPGSIWLSRVFKEWIEGVDDEERKEFVDGFFNSLMAGGAQTMDSVTGKGLEEVIKAIINTSNTAKEVGWLLPKTAVRTSVEMASESLSDSISKLKENAVSSTKSLINAKREKRNE